jgi:hypothetical protein
MQVERQKRMQAQLPGQIPTISAPTPARGWQVTILQLLQLIGMLAILPAIFMAMMSGMVFDASGSEKSVLAQCVFFGLLAAPVVAISTIFVARGALRRFTPVRLATAIVLPLGWAAFMYAVVTALNILCNGEFTCAY